MERPEWIDADKEKPDCDMPVLVMTEDRAGVGFYDSEVGKKWYMWVLKNGRYEVMNGADVCYWFPIPYIPGTPNFPPLPVWVRTGKEKADMHMALPNRGGGYESWLN